MNSDKEKILADRERREAIVKAKANQGFVVLVLHANIPGDDKNIVEAYHLLKIFYNFVVEDAFTKEFHESIDGPFYLFTFNDVSAGVLKERMIYIEENHELGRFIDIDVYDKSGPMSRPVKRSCFLCGELAAECIRSKKHTVAETLDYLVSKVNAFIDDKIRNIIDESIMLELDLHPKFGMVTPLTNGNHPDMSYDLMVRAKNVILPYFMEMYRLAKKCDKDELFAEIRKIGLEAEKMMFYETGGINAYKGLIFNLGLFVTSFAYLMANPDIYLDIFDLIKDLVKDILSDFDRETDSFGYEAFKEYGITGARGEALKGYIHVREAGRYLSDLSEKRRTETLAYLIANIDDTNLLKRSGSYEKYLENKQFFEALFKYDPEQVKRLDEYCLQHNLSFGGSADLLVTTIFMKKINRFYKLRDTARN